MKFCECCDPEFPASAAVYLTFHGISVADPFADPDCTSACEAMNRCFELALNPGPILINTSSPPDEEPNWVEGGTDYCRWTNAGIASECFQLGDIRASISCTPLGDLILRVQWRIDEFNVAVWQKSIPQQQIRCDDCTSYELTPPGGVFPLPDGPCFLSGSSVEWRFQPYDGCTSFCVDNAYQITIDGIEENDPSERCTDADCESFNGEYLVSFQQNNTQPKVCPDGNTDWTEFRLPLNYRCTDARFGFCSLHLFLRLTNMCDLQVVVELRFDGVISEDCADPGIDERVGWGAFVSAANHDNCEFDVPMNVSNLCIDNNWNCNSDTVTIRVRNVPSPRAAITRLTPMGVPGRRFGA